MSLNTLKDEINKPARNGQVFMLCKKSFILLTFYIAHLKPSFPLVKKENNEG